MSTISEKKYTGDGGSERHIFTRDARIGWRTLLNDPTKHLSNGIAQYEYHVGSDHQRSATKRQFSGPTGAQLELCPCLILSACLCMKCMHEIPQIP